MDPATATLLAGLIGAGGAIGGGMLSNRGGQETKTQKQKRHLIDELMNSLDGDGKFSDLFNSDEGAFQKSFVDPAKSMFKNQIAPQIQQQYIAGGQQRGTGIEDQLLRAGVDMDQLLNQNYMQFQNQGKDRMSQMMSMILGSESGAMPGVSGGQQFANATAGYLTSDSFSDGLKNVRNEYNDQYKLNRQKNQNNQNQPLPKGYEA